MSLRSSLSDLWDAFWTPIQRELCDHEFSPIAPPTNPPPDRPWLPSFAVVAVRCGACGHVTLAEAEDHNTGEVMYRLSVEEYLGIIQGTLDAENELEDASWDSD